MKRALYTLLIGLAAIGLSFFCKRQTHGFRLHTLLSNLPNDPRWDVEPLSSEQMSDMHHLLDQPFTFLGKGGWCTAFLGKDGKTVLKFYKHDHLSLPQILSHFESGKLLHQSSRLMQTASYFQEFNFKSCILLYTHVPQLTGLSYVHLNKTDGLFKPVILFDPIGIRHELDLNHTEFVVQQRADLLFERLQSLHDQGDLTGAQHHLDELFACLITLSQHGIRDLDQKLYENFGYVEDRAIALDLSSFIADPEITQPTAYKREIITKTLRLGRWLKKHYPELKIYFDEKINNLIES